MQVLPPEPQPVPEQQLASVTVILASRNEGELVADRLQELTFCDEVIVVAVDCDDRTREVAREFGREVVEWERVPMAELPRYELAKAAKHEWLLLNDPDEAIPTGLVAEVSAFLADPPKDVAVVHAPIVYHFRGKPLTGTYWGGVGFRPLLVRLSAVELSRNVHETYRVRAGMRSVRFEPGADNVIRHLWATSYRQWIAKHWRYVPYEGRVRADRGYITGYKGVARAPGRAFRLSFFERKGYRDGVRGFALSVLWSLYELASEISLLRELRRRQRVDASVAVRD